jgi:TolB-like protein/tRNA A-37 threonylcarbamoyl transferase component Bud32
MDTLANLRAALSGRYEIEKQLGQGGMATVYLVRDLKHERSVALKVLHPDLAASLGAERFRREIGLAARLQHPHILTVLDSGAEGESVWFTMPYVEGETLRDRLRRDRQLSLDDAVRITVDAARALDYAHSHGVVHRDIKPENILITREGDTLVADFGIARVLSGAVDRLTATGIAVGTPSYMSPEQVAGEPALDPRTDVYSLGCTVFEMLAGEPPFTGATAHAVMAKRLSGVVPGIRAARPSVPEAMDRAVQRALAPAPADRFPTAGQFAQALAAAARQATHETGAPTGTIAKAVARHRRRSLGFATLAFGFLLGVGVLFAWSRNDRRAVSRDRGKVVAVLPFENLGAPDDAYFADGITDELRGKLSALPGLQVIASRSSAEYKHSTKSLTAIAGELGADYLVVGKVRWAKVAGGESRVQVSPELVEIAGRAPTTKWEQPFDAALTDVFRVQADIATQVAASLGLQLGSRQEQALAARPTTNLEAYDAYLRARELLQGATLPGPTQQAESLYARAISLDSNFAAAWAELSQTHMLLYINLTPSSTEAARARAAAERALALDPSLPAGFRALGDYYAFVAHDAAHAREAYGKGLALAPGDTRLLSTSAQLEQSLGHWNDALAQLTRAQQLDPRSVDVIWRRGTALLLLRRLAESATAYDQALAIKPASPILIDERTMVAVAQGDLAAAQRVIHAAPASLSATELAKTFGFYWDMYWLLDDAHQRLLTSLPLATIGEGDVGAGALVAAEVYALRGDRRLAAVFADSARAHLEQQLRDVPNNAERRVGLALALAYVGRMKDAVREAERGAALAAKDAGIVGVYDRHQLVRVYILAGETDKAIDVLEGLLAHPGYLTPAWLRVDPNFAPLRGNPRFAKLSQG